MIEVQQNKNTIFFSLVIYLLLFKELELKTPTKLATKVFKDFENINETKEAKEFIARYKDSNPLKISYQYNLLSLYTDSTYSIKYKKESKILKEILNDSEYIKHIETIKELFPKLNDSIKFDDYYEKNILSTYQDLIKDIQEIFNFNPKIYESLISFWKIAFQPELIFIPNFLSTGDCFGLRKEKKFYSVTSAKINKDTGEREFYPAHVISNSIHEFSHSFLDEAIKYENLVENISDLEKEKYQRITNGEIDSQILKIYGSKYFIECFDRAVTLRVKEMAEVSNVKENYFNEEKQRGYIFTELFYENLLNNEDSSPGKIYVETLKSI